MNTFFDIETKELNGWNDALIALYALNWHFKNRRDHHRQPVQFNGLRYLLRILQRLSCENILYCASDVEESRITKYGKPHDFIPWLLIDNLILIYLYNRK